MIPYGYGDPCEVCGQEMDPYGDPEYYIEVDTGREIVHVCSEECRDELLGDLEDARHWDYEDRLLNDCDFRDPGGNSALRNGPRIYPCPTCGRSHMLSPLDVQMGYQCDDCADRLERGGY